MHEKSIRNLKSAIIGTVSALAATCLFAAEPGQKGVLLPLYEEAMNSVLGVPETRSVMEGTGETLIFNVSEPALELFRPDPNSRTDTAVIVAPGGGFVALAYEHGGTAIAQKLAEHGITSLVLKYRTILSSGDPMQIPEVHQQEMDTLMARIDTGEPVEIPEFAGEQMAVEDGARALEIVRQNASAWGIDPERVGILGLSAGAFIAADLAVGDESSRPNFVGMLYGGLRKPVPGDAPPAFIAAAADDELLPTDSLRMYTAWRSAGVPAELHMYEKGGHGFDIRPNGTTSDEWFSQFIKWMTARELINR